MMIHLVFVHYSHHFTKIDTETNFDEVMTTMHKDQVYHHTWLNYTIFKPINPGPTDPSLECLIDLHDSLTRLILKTVKTDSLFFTPLFIKRLR